MSSFYERNIWAFIQVLQHQPELLSKQDKADLKELDMAQTEDVKQISDTIEAWLNSHSQISATHVEYLTELCDGKPCRGPGGLPVPPPPPPPELRKQLENIIRRNRPAATQPKPKPDEKFK
jgi:hypothetical protein